MSAISSAWNRLASWDEYDGEAKVSSKGETEISYRVRVTNKKEALWFHPKKTLGGMVGGIGIVVALVFRNLRVPLGIASASLAGSCGYLLYTYRLTRSDVAKRQLIRAVEDLRTQHPAALRVRLSVVIEKEQSRFRRVSLCNLTCEQPAQEVERLFRGIVILGCVRIVVQKEKW